MYKLWIIGPPGAGKTTLSVHIAKELNIQRIELDGLYWKENWRRSTDEEFLLKIKDSIKESNGYIIDGYYEHIKKYLESLEPIIIKLDVPYYKLLLRVMKRSIHRVITQKKVCGDNMESIGTLLGAKGLLQYTYQQYRFFKNEYKRAPQLKQLEIDDTMNKKELIFQLKFVLDEKE